MKRAEKGAHSHLAHGTLCPQPQNPCRVILSLHNPCVFLDAWCSRKPSWHEVVSVSEPFSTCTYHIPTRLVKQAFSFNTVKSLYSQQQTHGLRLADTTCFFLQHPPTPNPNLSALTKPSVSRNICLQTNASSEQYQELKQTSQTCPQLHPWSLYEQCVSLATAFVPFRLSICLHVWLPLAPSTY